MKVRTNILIDKTILQKAHKLGLNVSKVCENTLKHYIEAIENATQQTTLKIKTESENNQNNEGKRGNRRFLQWTEGDLNPRPPHCEARTYGSSDSLCSDGIHCEDLNDKRVDWVAFKEWLSREYKPKTAYDIMHYLKRYAHCLLDRDFKPLLDLSKDKRRHCMAALSTLSKFLGIHEQFSALVKNYGLKWSVRTDDLIITRFIKATDPNEMFEWIKQVKKACPELKDFMDFMAASGLRYEEAVESYNLIIKLAKKEKLNEYYDSERGLLEHYKFKDIFLRRTKKAFISFVSKELIQKISDNKQLNKYSVQTKVKRKIHSLRFGDIRELHGSLLAKQLSEIEINFLHGRISTTVFMRNYFNPTWITDLKQRTFKAAENILSQI